MATKSSYTSDSGEDYGVYFKSAEDIWTYPDGDEFSASLKAEIRLNSTLNYKSSSKLCDRCLNIDLQAPLLWLQNLKDDDCDLCQMLSKIPNKARINEPEIGLLKARQYVSICAVPEPQDNSAKSKLIRAGLPVILQSGSTLYFELIKEWILLCNIGKCGRYNRCCPMSNRALMPTRVIDVVDGRTARLVLTDKDNISKRAQYIALSHCWGKLTENQKEKWCTTTGNKEERRAQGFPVIELPQTFQDAIRVTRELGQRYLWIDLFCIIQGEGGDWETESKKMEAVFKNAYCTIAATSAEDSTKGFLKRPLKERDLQYVTVPKSSHGKLYICRSIDNFDSDVLEGVLNKRAWVLQERALSRRTIHFTERQTYWECGGGFRCETLTFMKNEKLSFQSDPEFPGSIRSRYKFAQLELFQSLFTNYSKLGITNPTDRPVAINSLAMALAKTLKTNVRYGIFESFLHRSLLWQPAQNTLTQISYPAGKAPPSWSWMAYHGQIQYLQIPYRNFEWDKSVRLVNVEGSDAAISPENDDYVLEARVRWLRNCKIKPEGVKRVICDKEDNEVGQLWVDTEAEVWLDTEPEVWCAIMGREPGVEDGNREYYVLFVTECATQLKFRRVGMGSIQQRFILFDGQDNTAQIL